MSEYLPILNQALTCLSFLRPNERGTIFLVLPAKTWDRLRYELGLAEIRQSEASGMGGILCHYRPPEGKNWAMGFWCQECWVERGQ